jgi:hypothetical protein
MKYEIKNFQDEGDNKLVGLFVIDDKGSRLAIDHRIPLQNGKTNEQYVAEAVKLSRTEIANWQNSIALIGRVWNSETNSFE